jgi:hypothetical protein
MMRTTHAITTASHARVRELRQPNMLRNSQQSTLRDIQVYEGEEQVPVLALLPT